MDHHVVEVVVLEATERAKVETHQDGHYLSVGKARFPVPVLLPVGFEGHFFMLGCSVIMDIVLHHLSFHIVIRNGNDVGGFRPAGRADGHKVHHYGRTNLLGCMLQLDC